MKNTIMVQKQTLRIALDIAMTAILLCAYNSRLARETEHKWIGIVLFVLFAIHIFINQHRFFSMFKGVYTLYCIILSVVNVLLVLAMTILLITGILEALWVPSLLILEGRFTIRQIHTTAAYWLMPLIGVHLGFHWRMFSKFIGANRIVVTVMHSACGLL
jgi:hypothetical protein